MPRKSASKKTRSADMSMAELVTQAEQRIEQISQQRIAEVRALFDKVLERTQLSIREVYGQMKGQVSEAVSRVSAEWDAATGSGKAKAAAKSSPAKTRRKAASPIKGSKLPPKFRHPDDPNLTWAGRGAQPRWMRDAIAAGADIESFRVGGAAGRKGKPASKRGSGKVAKTAKRASKTRKSNKA